MNLGMLQRAITRNRYVRNRSAYRELLAHIETHGDVWKAPQREVAAWWQRRQGATLDLRVAEHGTLEVRCGLEGSVVEIGGNELRVPPFTSPVSSSLPTGATEITFHCDPADQDFAREIFAHLGYAHVTPVYLNDVADVKQETLKPIFARLRDMANVHQRYGEEDIAALRAAVRAAHERHGVPELRLWTLPHRDGLPYRVCVSPRFDVDKAIVNMPLIHDLEGSHGMRSTAYVRPCGPFYGAREIGRYLERLGGNEIALHGEFVTTARRRFGDEFKAAAAEKRLLEFITGEEAAGVCMHGGELSYNMSQSTRPAIEAAGFKYETMYRNSYFHPLHLPNGLATLRTLTIGQHFADLNVKPGRDFAEELLASLVDRFSKASAVGGVFVPVLHPLYFDLAHYLANVENLFRLGAYMPRYVADVIRLRRGQRYLNKE